MGTDKEIVEKRQGKMSATGDILSGKGGRKVFSGVWVILFANVWFGLTIWANRGVQLAEHTSVVGLSEKGYLYLSLGAILLIGFGTLLDTFFADLGKRIVDVIGMIVGSRVGAIASKVEKVEVTKTSSESISTEQPT